MSVEPYKRARAATYLAFICAVGWVSSVNAQEFHRDIPPNGHYSAGEQGWACNNGFRQIAGLCMEDGHELPSRGAFEVFVNGQWRCRPGYHREGGFCVPAIATAPAHATFVEGGDHWECEWGFQKIGSSCEEIKPPAHAYVAASGRDWVCYPGFERRADHCFATPSSGPGGTQTPTSTPSEEPRPDTVSPTGKR